MSLAYSVYECRIKICIVSGKHGIFTAEPHKHFKSLFFFGGIFYIFIAYACKFGYFFGNMNFRVYFCVESINYLQIFEFYSTYFRKSVMFIVKTCGFNIKDNYFVIEISAVRFFDYHFTVDIIYNICLTAVYYLEIFGHIVHTVGECLHTAVVGYRHSLMTPFLSPFYECYGVCYSVHSGHIRMTVKFNTLFGVRIFFGYAFY